MKKELLYELYQQCFPKIGCKEALFYEKINLGRCNVFTKEDETGGMLTGASILTEDTLTLLMVHPDYQGQGIGSSLLRQAEQSAKEAGFSELYLGFHSGESLFQGVPIMGEEKTFAFFKKNGYEEIKWFCDLILYLKDFDYQKALTRIKTPDLSGITFRYANAKDAQRLRSAVCEVDEEWCQYVSPGPDTLLVEENGEILGFECVNTDGFKSPGSADLQCGAVGCVGVVPAARKKGIGKVMVLYGTEELRKRGVDVCYIGMTHLEGWYQSMGFTTFLHFWHGKKKLLIPSSPASHSPALLPN